MMRKTMIFLVCSALIMNVYAQTSSNIDYSGSKKHTYTKTPYVKTHQHSHNQKNIKTSTSIGLNTNKLNKIIGINGQIDPIERTYKISAPRDDLKISMNGAQISSEMGLTSWVTFKKEHDTTALYGELILTPEQIKPMMDVILKNGIQITYLGDQFLWDTPRIISMHIQSIGQTEKLALIVKKLLTTMNANIDGNGELPLANISSENTTLNPKRLDAILGTNGVLKNGVYKMSVTKEININPQFYNYSIWAPVNIVLPTFTLTNTSPLPMSLIKDVNNQDNDNKKILLKTWAAFIGSDKESMVNGNFVIKQNDLQKVLIALHNAGIFVMQIHQHAFTPDIHIVSLHFMGVGNTKLLAKGIRNAMDNSD